MRGRSTRFELLQNLQQFKPRAPLPHHGRRVQDVPAQWNKESLPRIERHLRTLSTHAAEFAEDVIRRLA
jgi:hypothetical protein